MSKKLTVYQIDFKYRAYLRKICINALNFYRGVPLTWEDIYNNFLFEAETLLAEYKESAGVSVQTFLGVKCKYFAFNYCKSFETNKHKIMNKSVSIEENANVPLADYVEIQQTVDTSMFTEQEIKVYMQHFLEGNNCEKVAESMGVTVYKVRKIVKNIKVKMLMMLKN